MKVTLEFDSPQAADRFMIWWLDGGGEQHLGFETMSFNIVKGYMRIEGEGIVDEEPQE